MRYATPEALASGLQASASGGFLVLAGLLIFGGLLALLVLKRRGRHGQAFVDPYRNAGSNPSAQPSPNP